MKNPSNILNKIFFNKYFYFLIPLVNPIITLIKQKCLVITSVSKNGEWTFKEDGKYLLFDNRPDWNLSFNRLEDNLKRIPCKYYLPKEKDIVIDLGAGVGEETIIFSKLVGDLGKVYSIEAHPRTYHCLENLVKSNSMSNVLTSNLAIGNINNEIFFSDFNNHEANKILKVAASFNAGLKIKQITLDHFIEMNNIIKIDFLKINIEGAEFEIIENMSQSIKIIKNIAVSCHDFLSENISKNIKRTLTSYLENNGFDVISLQTEHTVRDSWIYGKNNNVL